MPYAHSTPSCLSVPCRTANRSRPGTGRPPAGV
jgi:hypothetical protein